MNQGPAAAGFLQVLRNPRFLKLWLGQVISSTGDYFTLLAVPILINRLTGSPGQIGAAMVLGFALPQLLFGIPAGVMVDRWDRRRVMVVTDLLRAAAVLGCLLVVEPQDVWILYAVGFAMTAASCLFAPAQMAVLPLLVSEGELLAANGLTHLMGTVAMLAGPALAGFTIGRFGERTAFVADSVSFVASALAVWSIGRVGRPSVRKGPTVRDIWYELIEGLRLLFGNRTLLGLTLCFGVVNLGYGAINVLWVPFLSRHHGVGAEGMGIVTSIQGVGMALGGLSVGWVARRFSKRLIGATGMIVVGLMVGLIGVAPGFAFVVGLTFVLGFAMAPVDATVTTLTQVVTPDAVRGRVFGARRTFASLTVIVSMAGASGAAELAGIPLVYVTGGALVVVAGIVFGIAVKEPATATGVCGYAKRD